MMRVLLALVMVSAACGREPPPNRRAQALRDLRVIAEYPDPVARRERFRRLPDLCEGLGYGGFTEACVELHRVLLFRLDIDAVVGVIHGSYTEKALRRIGPHLLLGALLDPRLAREPEAREQIRRQLERFDLTPQIEAAFIRETDSLGYLTDRALVHVIPLLRHPDADVRWRAVRAFSTGALVPLHVPGLLPALTGAIADPDPETAWAAQSLVREIAARGAPTPTATVKEILGADPIYHLRGRLLLRRRVHTCGVPLAWAALIADLDEPEHPLSNARNALRERARLCPDELPWQLLFGAWNQPAAVP